MQNNVHLPRNAQYVFLLGSLGDSLIETIAINHFIKAGYNVTVLGDNLYELRHWFPHVKILPVPKEEKKLIQRLQAFDQLILFHAQVKYFQEAFIPV